MSKKLLFLLLTLTVLTVLSGVYVVGGTQAYSRYQQNTQVNQGHCGGLPPVRVCVRMPSTIFSAFYPSYLSTQSSLFTVDYSSSDPLRLVISVSVARFSQVQAQTVTATTNKQSVIFIPPFLEQALRKLTVEEHTSLHIHVSDTRGHLYYVDDIPLLLHSRWLMQWIAANRLKIAAWVTPNDPAIADLVAKAATHLQDQQPPIPSGMIGYKTATPQQVIDQIDAIYDTLHLDYHMQYVQTNVPYGGTGKSNNSVTQNIKLPAEVLQYRSGTCVELTTLMASAAEHIGLQAEVVLIPGHAFLGVAVKEDHSHFEYWDMVDVNNNVTANFVNMVANTIYAKNVKQHTIVDTILISDARNRQIGPML